MMRTVLFASLLLIAALAACTSLRGPSLPPPAVVPFVDLARYAGTWYEIASYPNRFQKGCADTSATYTLLPGGPIEVVNRCTRGGKPDSVKGTAKVADPATNAKIKVTFFWPFSGNYWIIELGEGYDYAVVSEPGREYLWVLGRARRMDDAVYAGIVERLREKGFDTGRLVRTVQSGN